MDWQISPSTRAATAARRERLAARLGRTRAVVPAGSYVGRNYPDNLYPYRASSHFLYLVGAAIPDAVLVVDRGQATVYARPPDAADALWHGPRPDLAEMADQLGCAVASLDALAEALKGSYGATPVQAPGPHLGLVGDSDPTLDEAVAQAMIALRLTHDAAAQDGLRAAAKATTAAHRAGMAATRPGRHEFNVCAAMEFALAERGCSTAYAPIVTVHGEVLHNHAHHHPLAAGDLLLADVGAETAGGWAGDVTRTWPVSGRFSSTQRAIYEVVLAAQQAAIEAARPGARYREVHLTACRKLTAGLVDLGILRGDVDELVADDVHALFFPHGVGHLLGLDVHDMEDLGDRAGYAAGRTRSDRFGLAFLRLDRDLVPGMAVTIEPGFYQVPAILEDPERTRRAGDRINRKRLAEFADVRGVRIEDDVLITEGPAEVLTQAAPKSVAEVEAAVQGG